MNRGVTIIIDSYNHEPFVEAAIESALAQTHDPVQVIVIDDGSTDRSPEIIKRFDEQVEAVFQRNQGQVAACRHALARAKHDIVIFLDSDDLLEPEAASVVAHAWWEGVAKVQYRLRVIDENGVANGNVFPKFADHLTPERVRSEMLRTGSYPDSPTSGNAYDRRFLETTLCLLPRANGFDGELNGIAPLYGDVISLNLPLGSYRIHHDNAFAQSRLDVDKFENYLRHSEARMDFVRAHFRSKGKILDEDVLDRDLKYLEYALVVEKLGDPAEREPRGIGRTAMLAIKAAWQSPHTLLHRLFRIFWMAGIAWSPKTIAVILAEQRFIPGRRFALLTRLVTSRTKANPKAPELSNGRPPTASQAPAAGRAPTAGRSANVEAKAAAR